MKTRIVAFVCTCLVSVSLAAGPSIVGSWESLKDLPNYPGSKDTLHFEANGNYTYAGPGAYTGKWKQTGNIVKVTDNGEVLSTIKIIQLTGDRLTVQIDSGKPSTYKRVGGSSTSGDKGASGSGYAVKDRIQVEWNGQWYPAVILKVKGNKYFIHYDGYDNSYDEWVGEKRMKR